MSIHLMKFVLLFAVAWILATQTKAWPVRRKLNRYRTTPQPLDEEELEEAADDLVTKMENDVYEKVRTNLGADNPKCPECDCTSANKYDKTDVEEERDQKVEDTRRKAYDNGDRYTQRLEVRPSRYCRNPIKVHRFHREYSVIDHQANVIRNVSQEEFAHPGGFPMEMINTRESFHQYIGLRFGVKVPEATHPWFGTKVIGVSFANTGRFSDDLFAVEYIGKRDHKRTHRIPGATEVYKYKDGVLFPRPVWANYLVIYPRTYGPEGPRVQEPIYLYVCKLS